MGRSVIVSVPGVSGVSVGALSSGAAITYFHPCDGIVTGLLALPRTGLPSNAGELSLSILDASMQALFSDGRNGVLSAPFALLSGLGWRWFPMAHEVKRGSSWIFQVTNANAGVALVPNVLLRMETNQ